jgi:outer membrane lipoprotein-sorting protein
MVHRFLRIAVLCLVLLSSTTLAGCLDDAGTADDAAAPETTAGVATTQAVSENGSAQPDGEAVVTAFRERMSSLDSYVATRRTNVTVGENVTTSEVRMWVRVDDRQLRQAVVAPAERAGTVILRNESAMTVYDPDAAAVTTFPQSADSVTMTGFPVQSLLERTTVEFVGVAELDGEDHYRVRFVPNESMAGNVSLVGWLDTETYFPSRVVSTSTVGDRAYTSATTFEDVRLDVEIDDDRFTLDVPADVEWSEHRTPEVTTFERVALLRTNTSLHVPAPDVPTGFALGRAQLSAGSVERATLQYTNGSASLTVLIRNGTPSGPPSEAEAVAVDGRTVHYVGSGEGGYVQWQCGDQAYVVSGSLPRGTLLEIAASMSCS